MTFHREHWGNSMAKGSHLITHGLSSRPEYRVWGAMTERCTNPHNKAYEYYGARGISVCERWKRFELFLLDMGERPSTKHSIERKDVNGNYTPDNCHWATCSDQMRNRTDSKFLTLNGVTKHLSTWAEDLGIKRSTLAQRIYVYKWSVERALCN